MYTCKLNCGQPRFTFIQNEYAGNTNNTDHVDAPKHVCTYICIQDEADNNFVVFDLLIIMTTQTNTIYYWYSIREIFFDIVQEFSCGITSDLFDCVMPITCM